MLGLEKVAQRHLEGAYNFDRGKPYLHMIVLVNALHMKVHRRRMKNSNI